MRLIYFLTLVLLPWFSWSAPDTGITPNKIDAGPHSPWIDEGPILIAGRFNMDHTLTISVGGMSGPLVDSGEVRSTTLLAISQTNYNANFTAQNYGIELTELGMVGMHWDFRTTMALGKWYEPYYQWGLGALYKPQENLATFINYQRYQARIGCGFEDLLSWERRLRLELSLGLSPIGLMVGMQLGYTWAD